MRKTIYILMLLICFVGCLNKQSTPYDEWARRKEILIEEELNQPLTAEERDSSLRDWPFPGANGNWIPSRDGLDNCDTIVNGFPYNHI